MTNQPASDASWSRFLSASRKFSGPRRAAELAPIRAPALQQLTPAEVALWLNNRAYTLVFLGQATDALDNLKDADELLAGDEGSSRDPLLTACISGTRGIALLHHGDLDAAEKALELALRQEEEGVARQFDPEWQADPARTAERWFWLGEVARRRGELPAARLRLERAASSSTVPFGRRAQKVLADLVQVLPGESGLAKALPLPAAPTAVSPDSEPAIKPS